MGVVGKIPSGKIAIDHDVGSPAGVNMSTKLTCFGEVTEIHVRGKLDGACVNDEWRSVTIATSLVSSTLNERAAREF